MSIEIPDLHSAGAEKLAACGRVYTKDKELKKWADDHSERLYCYAFKGPSGFLYCHVDLDDGEEYIHFHIDLTTKKAARRPPREEIDFEELVKPFTGQEVQTWVYSDLAVNASELPQVIKAVSKLSVTEGGVTLRMTGCTFSIDGPPIETIAWHIPDNKHGANLEVGGRTKFTVAPSYLDDCLRFVLSWSDLLVRKGKRDA